MSIEKTKSGKYRVHIYSGRSRVAVSQVLDTLEAARKWEVVYKRRALNGELAIPEQDASIKEVLAEYAGQLNETAGDRHRTEVLVTIGRFVDHYGIERPSDIRVDQINTWARGLSGSSLYRGRRLRHLRAFIKFMVRQGHLNTDISLRVERIRMRNNREPRVLSQAELGQLLDSVEKHAASILPIVKFLALSGFRKLEAVALEWSDVDFEHRTVSIADKPHLVLDGRPFRCKWGSGRTIPMSEDMEHLLRSLSQTSTFVFPGPAGGNANYEARRFRKAVSLSGIKRPEELNLHTLRHSFATKLAKAGIDIQAIKQYCGHRNLQTTERYLHGLSDPARMRLDASRFPGLGTHRAHTPDIRVVG